MNNTPPRVIRTNASNHLRLMGQLAADAFSDGKADATNESGYFCVIHFRNFARTSDHRLRPITLMNVPSGM
jgi:hypothetical protein